VKIFPNEAFGHVRVTVERPLRLRWEVTESTIATVIKAKPVEKLDPQVREHLRNILTAHRGTNSATEAEMVRRIDSDLSELHISGTALKAVYAALAVPDENAPPTMDRKGSPEPDPGLRDSENVPLPGITDDFAVNTTDRLSRLELRSAVHEYMRANVLPYVPDAWADLDSMRIGYEIPLTQHFYRHTPPRPLATIDEEIKALEAEIQGLLNEVTS